MFVPLRAFGTYVAPQKVVRSMRGRDRACRVCPHIGIAVGQKHTVRRQCRVSESVLLPTIVKVSSGNDFSLHCISLGHRRPRRSVIVRIVDWFLRRDRAITVGTAFVLLVIFGLIATPVVTSELATGAHTHIREVVDPFDETLGQIGELVASMENSFLRYVITGNSDDLRAYEDASRDVNSILPEARAGAERLDAQAARQADELEQAIRSWQQFSQSVIALRQEGRIEEAQRAAATGESARLVNDFWRRIIALHEHVVAVRNADRDRLDQMLNTQVVLSVALGILGIVAAAIVAVLSKRIARLYEEVRVERDHVAELAERESRRAAEVDAIIENMAEGVVVIDQSSQVVRFNRIARQMWGLPWTEGQYGHIRDLAPLDFRYQDGRLIPHDEWPIYRALRGETFRDFEATYIRPDGRRYYLRFGGSAVRDERGEVVLAINVFHDISQIRELEQQREEFISVVAHDLKGAITIIRGYSELLLRPEDGRTLPAVFQNAAETIDRQTRQLERMIEDLLDVSRIEARRLSLEKRPLDLVSLIRDVVERTEELTKGHPVRVHLRDTIPPVDADPGRIEQILTNLLSNAAKYSYPNTPIMIEIEPRKAEVMVSVTNEGPGIKKEDIPELFTRFYRTEAARLEGVPGLGLGLYITKGLVEDHGGRIWIESEVGRYATFRFTLPVSQNKQ